MSGRTYPAVSESPMNSNTSFFGVYIISSAACATRLCQRPTSLRYQGGSASCTHRIDLD
jgi:hypothetical protein